MTTAGSWIRIGSGALMLVLCMTLQLSAQEAGKASVSFFYPAQLARGQTTRVTVDGNFDSIQAVELTPAEGVTIQKIEPDATYEGRKPQKRWHVEFLVAADAKPGERSVVFVTPQGPTPPRKVLLPSHVPVLSNFKALTVERTPIRIVFSINVFDAEDDLESLMFTNSLKCGGSVAIGYSVVGEMKQLAHGKYALQATFNHKQSEALPATCQFSLALDDKNHYEGRLTVPVEFK
ncbi:MAG TPA: hypothetical protein VFV61_10245 [Pyrinomonadaceae bacterium]|nr:hypothetical protein [Pyrinomonadaceae bacterium]